MIEPSLQIGGGNWANKSDKLLGYHKDGANFYADELTFSRNSLGSYTDANGLIQSMPYNLLLDTDTLSSWSLEGGTLTSGQTDPNGGSTAFKYVQITGGIYSGGFSETSGSKTATIWLKSVSGTSMTCYVNDGNAGNFTVVNLTGDWQLFTVAYTTPTSRPSLYIYSISNAAGIYIWHPQLNSGSTAKPYFATTTRLNLARVDYKDNVNGSLLLEPQRTNVLLSSEDWTTNWTGSNRSVTANDIISSDGTQNADKLSAIGGASYYSQVRTSASGSNTFSVFLKFGNKTLQSIYAYSNGSYFSQSTFNLEAGTISSTAIGTAKIEDYGNGWYRCIVSGTAGSSTIEVGIEGIAIGAYTYAYGAQLEAGYPTSYIKSEGAATTRLADSCSKTGISDKIGQTEGTLFCEVSGESLQTNSRYMSISDFANPDKRLTIYQSEPVTRLINVYCSAGATFNITYSPPSGTLKIAVGYKSGDYVLYVNGVNAATSTESAVVACSDLGIGVNEYLGTANPPSVGYSQILLFPTRLTNAELETLTTI